MPSSHIGFPDSNVPPEQLYTPYEGIQVKGWPVMTMVRGQAVVENERLQVPLGFGRYINRKPVKYTELLK